MCFTFSPLTFSPQIAYLTWQEQDILPSKYALTNKLLFFSTITRKRWEKPWTSVWTAVITPSKAGIFQPILPLTLMNPATCKKVRTWREVLCVWPAVSPFPATRWRIYYLLTLAAIGKEIKQRGEKWSVSLTFPRTCLCPVLAGRKKPFRENLLRSCYLVDGSVRCALNSRGLPTRWPSRM